MAKLKSRIAAAELRCRDLEEALKPVAELKLREIGDVVMRARSLLLDRATPHADTAEAILRDLVSFAEAKGYKNLCKLGDAWARARQFVGDRP